MNGARLGGVGLLAALLTLAAPPSASADDNDELFFYRTDGLFRYYDVRPNGDVGTPILQGDGYTDDWTSITAVDLDGDG